MLATYIHYHHDQLLAISDAQYSPFTCVGFVKIQKKQLLEACWLTAKKNNKEQKFSQPDIKQLVSLIENGSSVELIAQACIEIMANLPQTTNLVFIDALLKEASLNELTQLIIYKVLLQQHSFNLIAFIDLKTICYSLAPHGNKAINSLKSIDAYNLVNVKSDNNDLLPIFDELCNCELTCSPLMSLFLLSLSWEQVNVVANHASNTLSMDGTLQVLLQSCFVKLIPLATTSLNNAENPRTIIALIRRVLGDKLDLLVDYDTQLQAWQGDEPSCQAFKTQLQQNWPKYENEFSSQRLISGNPLNNKLNAIELSAMDSYSQGVFNLYTYYQYLAAKRTNKEAIL